MRFPQRRDVPSIVGWLCMLLALASVLGLAFLPSPYAIERPGPTFDALGETDAGQLVTVPDDLAYDTDGSLTVLTVTTSGSPEHPLTWIDVAEAYLDGSQAIVPLELLYAPGETLEESTEQGAAQMQSSQQSATAAALMELGYDVEPTVTIDQVIDGSPADGVLESGDVLETVDGDVAWDVDSIRDSITRAGDEVELVVERDGVEQTVTLEPDMSTASPTIGIVPIAEYEMPIDVEIELPDVGGPSAGLVFTLAVVDMLTPGAMTGGEQWAGTGTISALGDVGAIGGIVQKMHGAVASGADWFLAPASNCQEVVGEVPDGLQVVAVETLGDAIHAIETVADEGATGSLPTCEAG